ncbi:hypothetical protein SUGI_0068920 [Cryptomeria japonica]|nr:hypothetical protein SUGI_0068920 [Cryptomeria japonica]
MADSFLLVSEDNASYSSVDDKGVCYNVCVSPSGDVDPGGCLLQMVLSSVVRMFILGFFSDCDLDLDISTLLVVPYKS